MNEKHILTSDEHITLYMLMYQNQNTNAEYSTIASGKFINNSNRLTNMVN